MFVELELGSEILAASLAETPGMNVSLERLDASETVPLRALFWASGADFARFEAAMNDDPTVASWCRMVESGGRTLYRIQYDGELTAIEAHGRIIELDGAVLGATNLEPGLWRLELTFPDRESLSAFRSYCEDLGKELRLASVRGHEYALSGVDPNLSDAQRETLQLARDRGYFSIPREASLADLAEDLGVSQQAASERIRRGMDTLVEHALDDGRDEESGQR